MNEKNPEKVRHLAENEANKNSEYKFTHDPEELLGIWTEAIGNVKAGEKVWFRTMLCKDGHTMGTLKQPLLDAAKKGADVRIIYDPISFYLSDDNVHSWLRYSHIPNLDYVGNEYKRNKKLINDLSDGGVKMDQSRPETFMRQAIPYKGADHIKGARIGDRYFFMFDNLEDGSFMRMKGGAMEIENPEMIEKLTEIIGSTKSPDKDETIKIKSDPETVIIWDAGIPGKSSIYEAALEIINNAKPDENLATSAQFFPEGRFLKGFESKQNSGVNTSIVTSRQKIFSPLTPYRYVNLINLNIMAHGNPVKSAINNSANMIPGVEISPRTPLRVTYAEPYGTHGKYVLTYPNDETNTNGNKAEVEFGTNNHSEWGIKAGTAELAIRSTNPKIVNPMIRYHKALAAGQI